MNAITNQTEATAAFKQLRRFIGPAQISAMADVCRTEEKKFMYGKLSELIQTIQDMPKTYETDGQGKAAVVQLHYFMGGMDWYITERDMENEQLQAFGLADLGHGGELGYISIVEIIAAGAELDLYWTPQPLSDCQ
jgi:Ca2+-binding EF-hand superfamily protein